MKCIFFILAFATVNLHAQTNLNFNKRFVESEDKWVAFQPGKDSAYMYGFIYIDGQAGLTFNYEGTFKISTIGTWVATKLDSTNIKSRLQPNNVLVAFIPADKFEELQIKPIPDWLKFYKTDTASVARLYKWGYMYNGWGECAKALSYLERAEKTDASFKGLEVELAFSYNCLKQFDKAIAALQNALATNPTDAYVNKELIYAEVESGQLDKASVSCKHALEICTDTSYNAENCYNLLHIYYVNKDKTNFAKWIDETKKWCANNPKMANSIKIMEDGLGK